MFEMDWFAIAGENIRINGLVYFLWSIWTGWIFSTIGAFGGIMAGYGHISILGLGGNASALKGTMIDHGGSQIDAGNYLSDNIRFSNNMLTFVSSIISTASWMLQKKLVWAAGVSLGIGAFVGAQIAVWTTGGKLGIGELMGIFGILTLIVAIFMFYNASPAGQKEKSAGKEASKRFQEKVKELKAAGRLNELEGITDVKLKASHLEFSFFGEKFEIKYLPQLLAGAVVGFLSTLIGVGGGFLYVPILSSLFGLPFYIVPGASALAVLIGMISSMIGWFIMGIELSTAVLIGMAGILIGSYIGPKTQKFLPMRVLYVLFGILAAYVGVRYILKGFFDLTLFGM